MGIYEIHKKVSLQEVAFFMGIYESLDFKGKHANR